MYEFLYIDFSSYLLLLDKKPLHFIELRLFSCYGKRSREIAKYGFQTKRWWTLCFIKLFYFHSRRHHHYHIHLHYNTVWLFFVVKAQTQHHIYFLFILISNLFVFSLDCVARTCACVCVWASKTHSCYGKFSLFLYLYMFK